MEKATSFVLNWIEFFIHIYIHVTATINAIVFVAKRDTKYPGTAQDIILKQRHTRSTKQPSAPLRRMPNREKQPTKSIFDSIPNEILIIMFENMDQNDLYHCSTVKKRWNDLLTPILWRSPVPTRSILNCSPTYSRMDKQSHQHQKMHISPGFPLHLSRYGHAVKSLDLSLIAPHVTDCTLRHIMRFCPHLTSLNLSNCRLITNEGLRCFSGSGLHVLALQNCRQITDTGLSNLNCHRLEMVHLGSCNRVSDNGIIALVTASGNTIRRINLSDCIRVTGSSLHKIAMLCGPRLEWLDISRTKAIQHSVLEHLVTHCPNISRLNVSIKKRKTIQELRSQLSLTRRQLSTIHNGEDLDESDAENPPNIDSDIINPLHELIDLLSQFNIQPNLTDSSAQHQQMLLSQQRGKDPVSNRTIELMAIHLKKLEHLNISYWTCLNDKAIHMLTAHSHCLTYLNLIGCQRVTKKALKYLSELCAKKSTCITLTDLMIFPPKKHSSCEGAWINTSSSGSSASSSEESDPKHSN